MRLEKLKAEGASRQAALARYAGGTRVQVGDTVHRLRRTWLGDWGLREGETRCGVLVNAWDHYADEAAGALCVACEHATEPKEAGDDEG